MHRPCYIVLEQTSSFDDFNFCENYSFREKTPQNSAEKGLAGDSHKVYSTEPNSLIHPIENFHRNEVRTHLYKSCDNVNILLIANDPEILDKRSIITFIIKYSEILNKEIQRFQNLYRVHLVVQYFNGDFKTKKTFVVGPDLSLDSLKFSSEDLEETSFSLVIENQENHRIQIINCVFFRENMHSTELRIVEHCTKQTIGQYNKIVGLVSAEQDSGKTDSLKKTLDRIISKVNFTFINKLKKGRFSQRSRKSQRSPKTNIQRFKFKNKLEGKHLNFKTSITEQSPQRKVKKEYFFEEFRRRKKPKLNKDRNLSFSNYQNSMNSFYQEQETKNLNRQTKQNLTLLNHKVDKMMSILNSSGFTDKPIKQEPSDLTLNKTHNQIENCLELLETQSFLPNSRTKKITKAKKMMLVKRGGESVGKTKSKYLCERELSLKDQFCRSLVKSNQDHKLAFRKMKREMKQEVSEICTLYMTMKPRTISNSGQKSRSLKVNLREALMNSKGHNKKKKKKIKKQTVYFSPKKCKIIKNRPRIVERKQKRSLNRSATNKSLFQNTLSNNSGSFKRMNMFSGSKKSCSAMVLPVEISSFKTKTHFHNRFARRMPPNIPKIKYRHCDSSSASYRVPDSFKNMHFELKTKIKSFNVLLETDLNLIRSKTKSTEISKLVNEILKRSKCLEKL